MKLTIEIYTDFIPEGETLPKILETIGRKAEACVLPAHWFTICSQNGVRIGQMKAQNIIATT
jgi:hypothetical protein